MKEKFGDVAQPGDRPSAAGWNERTRVLERLANPGISGGLGAVFTDAFTAYRGQSPFGLVMVRMVDDLAPWPAVNAPLSGPSGLPVPGDAGGDPTADDVVLANDQAGPPEPGIATYSVPPDQDTGLFDFDLDPANFDPSVVQSQPSGPYPGKTGFNAIVQEWDSQARAWFDTEEGLVVANAYQVPYRIDDILPAYWNGPMGAWVLLPADQVQLAVTTTWPGQSGPSGPLTGPTSGPPWYPYAAQNPNTYAVSFVAGSYTRIPGTQTVSVATLPGGPHAVVCNLNTTPGSYIAQGTLIWCFYLGGHWYTYLGQGGASGPSGPAGGGGGGGGVELMTASGASVVDLSCTVLRADTAGFMTWVNVSGGVDTMTFREATGSLSGIVSTGAQTFGGAKTFSAAVTCSTTLTVTTSVTVPSVGASTGLIVGTVSPWEIFVPDSSNPPYLRFTQGTTMFMQAGSTATTGADTGLFLTALGRVNAWSYGVYTASTSIAAGVSGTYGITVTKGLVTSIPTAPTVTGSRAGNAALASLLTALAGTGLIVDSSSV